eukprot:1140635-Pelagomonas_calceolata.AAC.2
MGTNGELTQRGRGDLAGTICKHTYPQQGPAANALVQKLALVQRLCCKGLGVEGPGTRAFGAKAPAPVVTFCSVNAMACLCSQARTLQPAGPEGRTCQCTDSHSWQGNRDASFQHEHT